jgi:hypothetical protein
MKWITVVTITIPAVVLSFHVHNKKPYSLLIASSTIVLRTTTTTTTIHQHQNVVDDSIPKRLEMKKGKVKHISSDHSNQSFHRTARRMNHHSKHLFRTSPQSWHETTENGDAMTFLQDYGNYTHDQIIVMNQSFPLLLSLSISRHLYPKLRFLQETMRYQPQDIVPYPYVTLSNLYIFDVHSFFKAHSNILAFLDS